jgi:hypothetical protein
MNPTDGVIREALDLYKKHFAHLFIVAFVIFAAIAVLQAVAASSDSMLALIIASVLSVIGYFLVQAALVEAVSDIRDGRADLSIGNTLSRGGARIGSVALASIVAGIAIVIGLVLLIIPGLVLLTWWAVIVPVIVLERVGAFDSFSRSRELVRGWDFKVFGVIVLEALLVIAVTLILGLILAPLPDGPQTFVSNVLSGSLTGPFSALITTLLYLRLKEARVA